MAAEQGDAYSQRVLAEMYYHGNGVAQDFVSAYVWMSLAAAQDSYYAEMRDIILNKMPPRQSEPAEEHSIELQNRIKLRSKENKP